MPDLPPAIEDSKNDFCNDVTAQLGPIPKFIGGLFLSRKLNSSNQNTASSRYYALILKLGCL